MLFHLIATILLLCLSSVLSTPSCQYAYPWGEATIPLGFCISLRDGSDGFVNSEQYVCNENGDGINWISYNQIECQGPSTSIPTKQFHDFNCSLPKCTDSDPLIKYRASLSGNCSDPFSGGSQNVTLIANDCEIYPFPQDGFKSNQLICSNKLNKSYTSLFYSDETCSTLIKNDTINNGCNHYTEKGVQKTSYIEIIECSVPAKSRKYTY